MIKTVYVFDGVERVRFVVGRDRVTELIVKDNCVNVQFDDGSNYLLYSPFIEVHNGPITLEESVSNLGSFGW